MNIMDTIGRCTQDETRELALQALRALTNDVARDVVVEWAKEYDMADELAIVLEVNND